MAAPFATHTVREPAWNDPCAITPQFRISLHNRFA
ncbi:hypothetical protein NK6_9097 [Bradyrhizobium diazoefficiens]|uniref:Uncharacterized protein n=1 Tax=Bradyrhizobium diazoefficiens TaxID=1355477 RepID=A0A0E3VX89_9BRAD|nr:hypothetical protein NK6_9097 [Bradyrhizobium diazoefficiens]